MHFLTHSRLAPKWMAFWRCSFNIRPLGKKHSWKKSFTTWNDWTPTKNGIFKLWNPTYYIPLYSIYIYIQYIHINRYEFLPSTISRDTPRRNPSAWKTWKTPATQLFCLHWFTLQAQICAMNGPDLKPWEEKHDSAVWSWNRVDGMVHWFYSWMLNYCLCILYTYIYIHIHIRMYQAIQSSTGESHEQWRKPVSFTFHKFLVG